MLAVTAAPGLLGVVAADLAGVAAILPDGSAAAVGGVVTFALPAGLVEEPGWWRVASTAWQTRMPPVWAALSIGALWALWHLPLYCVDGSYQQGLGFGSVRLWLTNVVLVQLSVLYVWLADGTGGSIPIVVLAHAGFNTAGELVPRSTTGDVVAFLAVTAATLVVIVATRDRLCRRPRTSLVGDLVA